MCDNKITIMKKNLFLANFNCQLLSTLTFLFDIPKYFCWEFKHIKLGFRIIRQLDNGYNNRYNSHNSESHDNLNLKKKLLQISIVYV